MSKNFFNIKNRAYIIAEIGVNHNGDLDLAKLLIKEAKQAGADAVKFQTFKAKSLVSKNTPKVRYQKHTTGEVETHYEMIENLELSNDDHFILQKYCNSINIEFISTPYDIESARFLSEELNVKLFKTASADIVDLPLQRYIAQTKKPSIVATGMATIEEINDVVEIYKKYNNNNLILLHCVSNYPCSDKSINMKVMRTIAKECNVPVGYSDHSVGEIASVMAIVYGAKVIEKHFTLDKTLSGPDHAASSTPEEFRKLVESVRRAEDMLGDGKKLCQEEEKEMKKVSRKSIHLLRDIEADQTILESDLTLMRPGTGIMAKDINIIVGKKASRSIKKGEMIQLKDIR